eukprot:s4530_g10.t1
MLYCSETAQGVPRCTCFLFIAAITCHSLVLFGNISTALMLKDLGSSAGGWGSVAFSVTHALDTELNPAMAQVTKWLTATIQATTALQQGMDTALSVTGSTVDSTLQNYAGAVELMDRMMCGNGGGGALWYRVWGPCPE